jgi:hypothetical protein
MAIHLIPATAIDRYSAAPAPSTVDAVKSLHENIRSVLGAGYETFLQGSYRNDTGVADLNDVDIVAIRKNTTSSHFTGIPPSIPISWDTIFDEVQQKLEGSYHYRGKTERGDKCITVNTNFHADVVPAVQITTADADPIAVYSFRYASERKNYPRIHARNNTDKHQRTKDNYKPMVRVFKRWSKNWFAGTKTAPSFYVECLVHWVPTEEFVSDRALSFFMIGNHIVQTVTATTYVPSVAGDKDILTSTEWDWERFSRFQRQLTQSTLDVGQALQATNQDEARRLWRKAFNE